MKSLFFLLLTIISALSLGAQSQTNQSVVSTNHPASISSTQSVLSLNAPSQTNQSSASAVPPAPTLSIQPPLTEKERDLMQQHIKTIEAFDDRLLKLVQWTLTSVFGVALLLVGYNWLTSFKVFERERERLKQEVINETNAAIVKLSGEIEKKLQSSVAEMDSKALTFKHELSNLATSLNTSVEQRVIGFSNDISARLETHRREIDDALRNITTKHLPDLETRLDTKIEKTKKEFEEILKSKAEQLKTDLTYVDWRLHNNLGDQSSRAEEWSQGVTWHIRAAKRACSVKWEWAISESLKKLQTCITSGGKPLKSEKEDMAKLEQRIPDKLVDQYKQANAAVQAAPEFPE